MMDSAGEYRAVMPVPLRRKRGMWVVHQPLFCQFLGVFGTNLTPNLVNAFAQKMLQQRWYGSILHLSPPFPPHSELFLFHSPTVCHTHLLDLSRSYETLYHHFSPDTRRHLRQAKTADWEVQESNDPRPLLSLFRHYQADRIPGGVGEWAYALFEHLFEELQKRRFATLRYALRSGQIEAGAVFVQSDNRIIYLFNAASELGRRNHARTLLINQMIREQAGCEGRLFDFESPEKESIARFYKGFGAEPSPYVVVRWNRLRWPLRHLSPTRHRVY